MPYHNERLYFILTLNNGFGGNKKGYFESIDGFCNEGVEGWFFFGLANKLRLFGPNLLLPTDSNLLRKQLEFQSSV